MRRADELFEIGYTVKLHGYKGEIETTSDYDELPLSDRWVFVEQDGLMVPFFIESCRPKGQNVLIRFRGVDSEEAARKLIRKELYIPVEEVPEGLEDEDDGNFYLTDMVGFEAYDGEHRLGLITACDDSTENYLFHIKPDEGDEFLIPAAPELIETYDPDEKTVVFSLPEGIRDL